MKITPKNVRKFQMGGPVGPEGAPMEAPVEEMPIEGGEMPAEQPMPALEQDPIIMIALIFAQGLQTQDCNLLALGAQAYLQLVDQMQGGAPAEAPGQPVYKKGGILSRRIKK